jgi:hypothetical protein
MAWIVAGQNGKMNRRRVKPVSADELKLLTTERLLAYRSKLLSLECLSTSDTTESEFEGLDHSFVYFKDEAAWQELYGTVKTILGGREHLEVSSEQRR